MQEISCKEFDSLLAEYVDGGLEQDARKGMASHSLQCRSCRALLDDVKVKLREVVRDYEIITNPKLDAVLELIPESESGLSCSSFEALVSDFLDGFVHASVYHRFAQHSDVCSKCSRVLTDVVYAVAACHSVHTYEDHEVPQTLADRLTEIGPGNRGTSAKSPTQVIGLGHWSTGGSSRPGLPGLRRGMYSLLPTTSVERVATVSGLLLASLAIAIFGLAGDTGVSGMFRKAQSRGTRFFSQQENVEARFEGVWEELGRVWKALGGTDSIDSGNDHGAPVPGHDQDRGGGQAH